MSAIISDCGLYRYRLERDEGDALATRGPALFIMLNPSTADAAEDDPTIRRCRSFAKSWGCSGIVVANLYALRATDPRELWLHSDPVGPENDRHLQRLAIEHDLVVCAWGANARSDRVATVRDMFSDWGARLMCLGVTERSGAPRHPLYVPSTQPLVEWKP
ncbi:MAG: DUF1643 domain-containing protein [Herbaspirillum huttiense]|uniref:DUF1643 domain-containing protein n=1 Tax=Herbaspirillum huttiense TaxID=863372 RepID=UPI001ACC1460|nr:DUF1643 domain-containing protein [Herbaspirillum huttiense]MBN9356180.1 DUF1643 domain-containing protein [Herbaspirillum huttiense]